MSEEYLIVGQFGAPHGVSGAIKIQSFTRPFSGIMGYKPWYVSQGGSWKRLELIEVSSLGDGVMARIEGYDDRDRVRVFTGLSIGIKRDQLPSLDDGSYYWTDLEGLRVVNLNQEELGRVDHLFTSGQTDILVVVGQRKHLIPFVLNQHVLSVDLTQKIITVDWDADF